MLNPNKYIRKAYLVALAGIGYPIYDKRVPADKDIPSAYLLISAQNKTERDRNKCDKNWNCTVQVDIYVRGKRGYADTAVVDDIEELVTSIITPDVQTDISLLPNFICYLTTQDENRDEPMETPTETIFTPGFDV